jgi:hypothetical protein
MRAKLIGGIVLGLILGVVAGWYLGYTRPSVQAIRDARKYVREMEHDDSVGVAVAMGAIRDLEQERSDKAKELLARQIGSYYVIYGPPDNPRKRISEDRMRVLRRIEEAAQKYPVIQAAIDKSRQNLK